MSTNRLALTMGDPAGVGPEIILKSLIVIGKRARSNGAALTVVGSREGFAAAARSFPEGEAALTGLLTGDTARFVDISEGVHTDRVHLGEVSAEAGTLAYLAIEKAAAMAMAGEVDGIVTAPLNKEAINRAGYAFSGHTELLAHLTGGREPVMMLAHGHMRVSHVTTHIAFSEVSKRMTPQRIRHVTMLTAECLRRMGIDEPRIAIAALNPHAGEGGILGTEDIDVTMPLVAELRSEGLSVEGPVPGDTVFVKLRARQYDAVVAMYHDQGHIPVKLLGFDIDEQTGQWTQLNGVNMTLGLPIIRTSVDHGTAFDIAGRGVASESSLVEAISYAEQLCGWPLAGARGAA